MTIVKFLGWGFLGALFLSLSGLLLTIIGLDFLVDVASIQVIALPLFFLGWISYTKGESFNKILMVLGIPLGLIGVMIGINGQAIVIITSEPTINSLGETAFASSVALLCEVKRK